MTAIPCDCLIVQPPNLWYRHSCFANTRLHIGIAYNALNPLDLFRLLRNMAMRLTSSARGFYLGNRAFFQGELSVSDMQEVRQALLTGERAEFQASDKRYIDTIFDDGESPLKPHMLLSLSRVHSNGSIRCGIARIFRRRIARGSRWHAQACGTQTTFASRIAHLKRRRISAVAMMFR